MNDNARSHEREDSQKPCLVLKSYEYITDKSRLL
jgi:hypothetical protein